MGRILRTTAPGHKRESPAEGQLGNLPSLGKRMMLLAVLSGEFFTRPAGCANREPEFEMPHTRNRRGAVAR